MRVRRYPPVVFVFLYADFFLRRAVALAVVVVVVIGAGKGKGVCSVHGRELKACGWCVQVGMGGVCVAEKEIDGGIQFESSRLPDFGGRSMLEIDLNTFLQYPLPGVLRGDDGV